MSQQRPIAARLLRLLLLAVVAFAALPGQAGVPVAQAATNTLKLRVLSARTEPRAGVSKGDAVTQYKFIINQDNVGNPHQARNAGCSPSNANYPTGCTWPSIQAQNGFAPIVAQGDQNDLNSVAGLNLPDGKYLISVLADGYKLDGQWFSVPLQGDGLVTVEAQPLPLPTATIRVKVFEDNAIVNGAPDIPAENGLAGFRGVVNDVLGQVSTDVFGNPICTTYLTDSSGNVVLDPDGTPQQILQIGGNCYSDANGDLVIPNLGPNRYTVQVIPPNGTSWVQTTTLEGNKDWDTWVQEGSTGFDTEFSIAGEPFPMVPFGFVRPVNQLPSAAAGHIKGVIAAAKVYVPTAGGLPYNGQIWGGFAGSKIDKPIDRPWIALNDLQNGDQAVYVGRGNADGSFDIPHVRDGNYTLTYWDDGLNYLLDLVNVTVKNGQVVDTGVLFLTGWWATVHGKICNDTNSNGKCDAGEPGISGFPVSAKRRTNSLMDRGSIGVFTDSQGNYELDNLYPLTQWVVIEAYNDRYYTQGITYQADNQPSETTVLGQGVDVNVLPIIGLSGRLDWAVKPYDATGRNGGPRNGGIVGTVSYDTTRNELDPRYAAVENWQVGIPHLNVNLYATVPCNAGEPDCVPNPSGGIGYFKVDAATGAFVKGALLNTYETESWARPKDCAALDVNGDAVPQNVLPPASGGHDCLEGPLMGIQFDEEFATVDGNFGFGSIAFDASGNAIPEDQQQALPAGDYLVEVEIPNDPVTHRPMYNVTREEDINVFSGDQYVPQVPPPACAGALHTVDVAGIGADGPGATANPSFVEAGGSPYEGQQKPLCDVKFVTLNNGRSIAPTFNLFTDVPLPGRYFGYIVDDLNISTNPQDLFFGEKRGIGNMPIGVYDYANRLVTTVDSDPNGVYEVLLPSTSTINCPSPSGVCANLYRLVGNDPGVPGRLNYNYNPAYRTIAATFEIFPGDIIPADNAPTTIGVTIEAPGSQVVAPAQCELDVAQPQLFAVSKPYVRTSDSGAARTITIAGMGFGASQGTGTVKLDSTALTVSGWSDRQITASIPTSVAAGTHQLTITAANGLSTVNGLTFHVLGGGYNPTLREVGPGKPYASIQAALDAVANAQQALVVVYPGGVPDSTNPAYNPQKAYFENLIVTAPAKIQGVGPGGVYPDNTVVEGSVIDGAAFGGDTALADAWRARVATLTWSGNPNVYEGAVVTILAQQNGPRAFGASFKAAIDGFTIQGGDQQGFPNNINVIGGTPTGQPAAVEVQGGGIFANAYASNLQITNNILRSNGGAYGGAVRLGTPNLAADPANAPFANSHNTNVRIANNRMVLNGGTNLAGAVGLFTGSDGYEIADNDFCGNFSAEYGGAISHYGRSPNGKIHGNRIYFNQSYDEGGAIMIAGELPADPNALSQGAGAVDIYDNLIQSNLSNDDGGGIRLLQAGNFPFNIYNNMVVNNISTHEGGGIALDDAPNVRVFNNTIMKNITTATAATSNGSPAPAGLSTGRNSDQLQATLPGGSPIFSNPLLFNNIFWDNRAGTWNGASVAGIGLPGDPSQPNHWDLGVADGSGTLAPTSSIVQQDAGVYAYVTSATNLNADPQVVATYDTSVAVFPWRGNPSVVGATIVAVELPPNRLGDYHLKATSPAKDKGAASKAIPSYQQPATTLAAPAADIDGDGRPAGAGYDIGADEIGSGGTTPPPSPDLLYLSLADNQNLPGTSGTLAVADEDIVAFDGTSYSMVFDGSDINGTVANADIDAFAIVNDTTILMSFGGSISAGGLPGIPSSFGAISPSDIVQFNATSLGTNTAGTFSVYFDGSDAGLTSSSENVDALERLPDGSLVLSTAGAYSVGSGAGTIADLGGADLLRCAGTFGANTSCTWSMYFDGSDVGLGSAPPVGALVSENVDAAALGGDGSIYLSTAGNFSVTGASGEGRDVFVCGSPTTGANTACTFSPALFFDGSAHSISGGNNVDAIELYPAIAPPPAPAASFATPLLDSFALQSGAVGKNWRGTTASFTAQGGAVQVAGPGTLVWNKSTFKRNQEARLTFTTIGAAGAQGLMLKVNGLKKDLINSKTSLIAVRYDPAAGAVLVDTLAPQQGEVRRATFAATFAAGDTLSAQSLSNGTVNVFKNGTLIGTTNVTAGANPWPRKYADDSGKIGVIFGAGGAGFDDFGGGTLR